MDEEAVIRDSSMAEAVHIRSATLAWDRDGEPTLKK